jgi:peroxiredoxin/predicted 2-oxoglutarate/Fe(II)-dependent dioxygenase YbiX
MRSRSLSTVMDHRRMKDHDRIFVQIASYRDRECQWTLKDLFEKAARPERISVGICWQFDPDLDQDCFSIEPPRPGQVRRIDVHARESRGVCWARQKTQELWAGEEYTLLTDAHMRFVPGWDEALIAELAECPSPKPLLSCNPPPYEPPDRLDENPMPTIRGIHPFQPDGTIRCRGIRLRRAPPHPLNGAFVVCCFVFSRADIIREVPYDPHLYFSQEEITLAARLWTHGWDVFSSRQVLLYHLYKSQAHPRPAHWDDHADWGALNRVANQRYQYLLGMRDGADAEALVDVERYGLGTARSLREYEEYSGVFFGRREVTDRASRCRFIKDLDRYNASSLRSAAAPPAAPQPAPAEAVTMGETPKPPLKAARGAAGADTRPYQVDHYFPPFELVNHDGGPVALDFYGGKELVVCFLPSSHPSYCVQLLREIARQHQALRERDADLLGISPEPPEVCARLRTEYGFPYRLASDPGGALRRKLDGAEGGARTYLLAPGGKIRKVYAPAEAGPHLAEVLAELSALLPPRAPIVITGHAPVAIVPRVLSAVMCRELMERHQAGPTIEGTIGLGAGLSVNPQVKARRELHVSRYQDADLLHRLDLTLGRTLLPEIEKLYGYRLTHRERYKIGCYDAAEQGRYIRHRDSDGRLLSYRRISLTINLNDDYEGGHLHFPEYGPYHYRQEPGAALIFPSGLLHEATVVTQGRRFILVSFLFEEKDAARRLSLLAAAGRPAAYDDTPVGCSTNPGR